MNVILVNGNEWQVGGAGVAGIPSRGTDRFDVLIYCYAAPLLAEEVHKKYNINN